MKITFSNQQEYEDHFRRIASDQAKLQILAALNGLDPEASTGELVAAARFRLGGGNGGSIRQLPPAPEFTLPPPTFPPALPPALPSAQPPAVPQLDSHFPPIEVQAVTVTSTPSSVPATVIQPRSNFWQSHPFLLKVASAASGIAIGFACLLLTGVLGWSDLTKFLGAAQIEDQPTAAPPIAPPIPEGTAQSTEEPQREASPPSINEVLENLRNCSIAEECN